MDEPVARPLAVLSLAHCCLEVWGPDEGHQHGHVRTVFPDGGAVTAAPNGGEDLLDTLWHELSHSLVAELQNDRASVCLRGVVDGHGRRWTEDKHAEETRSHALGLKLAQFAREVGRA